MTSRIVRLLAFGAVLLSAGTAFAGPKKDIEDLMVRAEEYSAKDSTKAVTQEVGLLRAWLTEARAFYEQEDEDEVKIALARARAAAQCIDATLQRADAEAAARQAETRAEAKEKQVAEQIAATRQLEREREAIEKGAH
jgi:hypothetical protein